MELGTILRNFVGLVYVGLVFAAVIAPISILLVFIVRDAWREGATALAAAPTGATPFLFLPTVGVLATLFAIAPSVCAEPKCTPDYDVARVLSGATLVVALMVYVARRHPLRSSPDGRELITATLVAQAYYAVVASWLAYWSMQSAGALAL